MPRVAAGERAPFYGCRRKVKSERGRELRLDGKKGGLYSVDRVCVMMGRWGHLDGLYIYILYTPRT